MADERAQAGENALRQEAGALAKDKGLSVKEATRRLEWQQRAAQFIDSARREIPGVFGGAWIDDGKLRLWNASPGNGDRALQRVAAQFDLGDVDIRDAKFSQKELDRVQGEIDNRLARANQGASTFVDVEPDVKANELVLRAPENTTPAQSAALSEIVQSYGEMVRRADRPVVATYEGCWGPWCSPPLRGGIGLVQNGTHWCSAGFVMLSNSDLRQYLSTQAHCGGGLWGSLFSDGSYHNIGPRHNYSSGDTAILALNNPTGWSPGPYIRMHGDLTYPIRRAIYPAVGADTCVSGSHTWTQNTCGTVSYGLATRQNVPWTMRAELTSCTTGGDSGSPYFKMGSAHGTHIGKYGSNPCATWFSSLGTYSWMNVSTWVQ